MPQGMETLPALNVQQAKFNQMKAQVQSVPIVDMVPELLNEFDVKSARMGKQHIDIQNQIKFHLLEYVNYVMRVIFLIRQEQLPGDIVKQLK